MFNQLQLLILSDAHIVLHLTRAHTFKLALCSLDLTLSAFDKCLIFWKNKITQVLFEHLVPDMKPTISLSSCGSF